MAMRHYAGFIDPIAALAAALGEFEAKPALARASLTDDADGAGLSGRRAAEFRLEKIELCAAANERTERRLAAENHAGRRMMQSLQPENLDRLGHAANRPKSN